MALLDRITDYLDNHPAIVENMQKPYRAVARAGYYAIGAPIIASFPARYSVKKFEAIHQRAAWLEPRSGLEAAILHTAPSAVVESVAAAVAIGFLYSTVYHADEFPSIALLLAPLGTAILLDGLGRMVTRTRAPSGFLGGLP